MASRWFCERKIYRHHPFCERKIYNFREIPLTEQVLTGEQPGTNRGDGMGTEAGDQPGRWGRVPIFLGEVARWFGHSLAEPVRWIRTQDVTLQGILVGAVASPLIAQHIVGTRSMEWRLGLAVQLLVTILVTFICAAGAIFLRTRK